MGGLSISLMFALFGGAVLLVLCVAALGVALVVAGAVVGIVFLCGRKKRAAAGRRLGGKIALPVSLLAVGLLLLGLVAGVVTWVGSGTGEEPLSPQLESYYSASRAIANHDEAALAASLGSGNVEASEYPYLLGHAIDFGDEACVGVLLATARNAGNPLDLAQPLPLRYSDTNEQRGSQHALILATGFNYHSLEMCQLLIDAGADVNVAALMEESGVEVGDTPLHLACSGMCNWMGDSPDERLADTRKAIEFFLERGADPAALDAEGRTPGQCYQAMLQRLVAGGDITQERANQEQAALADALGLSPGA